MKRITNFLSPFEHTSLIVLYVLIVLALFISGWYGLGLLFAEPGAFYALYIILFLFAGALLGAYLWVLITLPKGLAVEFDIIKNRIASGEISTVKDFSDELSRFLVKFFTFFRFDVVVAIVKVKGFQTSVFPVESSLPGIDVENLSLKSQKQEDVIYIGRVKYENQTLNGYLVPIWFGTDWLGYFCVLTDAKLYGMFKLILKNFEDQYIDDQLMHVLHRDNISEVRKLCSSLDAFSTRINKANFNSVTAFQDDLLKLLLRETGCRAGYIKSVFVNDSSQIGLPDPVPNKIALPEHNKTIHTGLEEWPLASVKWITTDEPLAVVVLLDASYEIISRAGSMLESCLVVKIGQQFTSLEHNLGLERLNRLK
nr:hypothetical protein [Bacteroidota bacterium]